MNPVTLKIARGDPTPIYRQIENWIRSQIVSGVWGVDFQLPSEVTLARALDTNRGTVRKALDGLIADGLLARVHGRGTFVVAPAVAQPLADRLTTFSEDLIGKQIPFVTRVLEQGIVAPPLFAASALALLPDAKVFYLKRVRDVDGQPFVLLENYVPYALCPDIENVDFSAYRLFEILEGRCGLKLDWGRRLFEARLAPKMVASALDIAEGAATMYLQQVVYLAGGAPVECSSVWLRGDRFKLSAVVRRSGGTELHGSVETYP